MKKIFSIFAAILFAGSMMAAIDNNSTWTETAFADLPDGATVVIINNFGNSIANATVTKAPAKVAASYNSSTKKISVTTSGKSLTDIAWKVEKTTNGTKFWVYESTTHLLGLSKTNDNNAVAVNVATTAKYNEFVMGSNGKLLKYYDAGRFVGEYVGGSDWRSYSTENANNYKKSGTEQALTFYVLDAAVECKSSVNIAKAEEAPEHGSFSLSVEGEVCIDGGKASTIVTATPDAHYHLASVNATVGTVGAISGNTCEITEIDADATISVEFEEDTKFAVTWSVNGETSTTQVYAGEKPVFPATPAAFDDNSTTFYGWATESWASKLENLEGKTVYKKAADMPAVDKAVTYYAVFTKATGSADSETLDEDEIKDNFTDESHKYTDDAVSFEDGDVTWKAVYNVDAAGRPWFQIKADAYLQITAPSDIVKVAVIVTSTSNQSGGIADKTKYNPFSSACTLALYSALDEEEPVGSVVSNTSDSYQELVIEDLSDDFNELFLKPSGACRVWEVTVTYGNVSYSDFITVKQGGSTAVDNTTVIKTVKTIENGMVIIEKNGVRYNVMGQIVK